MKVDAKLAELAPLMRKFAKRSCVGIFCNERTKSTPSDPKLNVLGRFGPLRYCTKVDAKPAELVPLAHKFAKQSRVRFFCNEHTRSTPLDPKLILANRSLLNKVASKFLATNAPDSLYWTQNSCFWAFWTISLQHESRCKTSRTSAINAKVR
jgi:hypothetical protein